MMTSVNAASTSSSPEPFAFNKEIFSDPSMRSYLEEYYDSKYAPFREHIAAMKEAEANGQAPKTITTPDGTIAKEFSADQYEAAIPSFDKWLELQEIFSAFDIAEQSSQMIKHAQSSLESLQKNFSPGQPSNVRTVFSDGDQILGYINNDGTVVSHNGAGILQELSQEAYRLNLSGEEKIAYLQEHGAAELSKRYPDLEVTKYTKDNSPTRSEFAQTWYPNHNESEAYTSALEDAKALPETTGKPLPTTT